MIPRRALRSALYPPVSCDAHRCSDSVQYNRPTRARCESREYSWARDRYTAATQPRQARSTLSDFRMSFEMPIRFISLSPDKQTVICAPLERAGLYPLASGKALVCPEDSLCFFSLSPIIPANWRDTEVASISIAIGVCGCGRSLRHTPPLGAQDSIRNRDQDLGEYVVMRGSGRIAKQLGAGVTPYIWPPLAALMPRPLSPRALGGKIGVFRGFAAHPPPIPSRGADRLSDNTAARSRPTLVARSGNRKLLKWRPAKGRWGWKSGDAFQEKAKSGRFAFASCFGGINAIWAFLPSLERGSF